MSKEPIITFEELMAEVERHKHTYPLSIFLTAEQFKFLKVARKRNISWRDIAKLWEKRWESRSKHWLHKRYYEKVGRTK